MNNKSTSSFNSIFDDFGGMFDGIFDGVKLNRVTPKVDAIANNNGVIMKVEMPGFLKENISIELEDSLLTISGIKIIEDADKKYCLKEISNESISRSFKLKFSANKNDIQAKYENGILTITIPKGEKDSSINIKID